ncbi:DUF3618 domain-containing protein [Streptomyces ardesiacus]|uniref:DUF3618 domain-containing protein n=1 Tax=Streptomyces TaxID=1883 RepID=UPI0006AF0DD2|nr:DUF3618 domain-containing protein [Streptomyces sp. NRRL F-7442]KOX45916.1 hypothetical protein ADL09_20485 [Streptomyces sp. NRRL F-7442]
MTDATSRDGTRSGSTAQPVGGAKGPDELRRQIEQTRGELGDTVEELAGKADVKGRAKARAADLKDRAGAMTVHLRSSAGHTVRGGAGRADPPSQRARGAVRAGLGHPRAVLVAGAAAGVAVAASLVRRHRHGPC